MRLIVTGGAGFIGSAVVCRAVGAGHDVLTIDKLTYAGRRAALGEIMDSRRHRFLQADIVDSRAIDSAFREFDPDAVLHLAAESHVDRSIDDPGAFIETNVRGTFVLLETALRHWSQLRGARHDGFRFVHVSTDEVFGTVAEEAALRCQQSLCTQFTVCCEQGRCGPPRKSVASNLWDAGYNHELLEQLRTLAACRKADPDGDPVCACWRTYSDLRHWPQHTGLALC